MMCNWLTTSGHCDEQVGGASEKERNDAGVGVMNALSITMNCFEWGEQGRGEEGSKRAFASSHLPTKEQRRSRRGVTCAAQLRHPFFFFFFLRSSLILIFRVRRFSLSRAPSCVTNHTLVSLCRGYGCDAPLAPRRRPALIACVTDERHCRELHLNIGIIEAPYPGYKYCSRLFFYDHTFTRIKCKDFRKLVRVTSTRRRDGARTQ